MSAEDGARWSNYSTSQEEMESHETTFFLIYSVSLEFDAADRRAGTNLGSGVLYKTGDGKCVQPMTSETVTFCRVDALHHDPRSMPTFFHTNDSMRCSLRLTKVETDVYI